MPKLQKMRPQSLRHFFSFFAALTLLLPVFSLWGNTPITPPSPIRIDSPIYLLVEPQSGRVLLEQDSDLPHPPASLAKLMTGYVVAGYLDNGSLAESDTVRISENAWRAEGSRTFLEAGSDVSIDTLLRGLIVQSGNDAAVALAEHIAGNEQKFAQELMMPVARQIGMNNSFFLNATGLPTQGMMTTAQDMAKLTAHVIYDHPDFYTRYKQQSFTHNNISQNNRNRLLFLDSAVDGVKTGHSSEAGYQVITSSEKNGMRLISVVMGAESDKMRTEDSLNLLEYGFRNFVSYHAYEQQEPIGKTRIWMGEKRLLNFGSPMPVVVTIPRGQNNNVHSFATINQPLSAPIAQGTTVGTLTIELGDEIINEYPLIALERIEEGNIFQRVWDSILKVFG